MQGVDLLIEMLVAQGVEVVFGVPGDTNVQFYDALRRNEHRITHVMARDERSAGFMADAYARVTRKVGVVEAPSGAGPMYTLPAVAEAQHSAVPLLLLTFDTPLRLERRGVISELDSATLFRSITKDSHQLKSAQQIPEQIRRAFRVATTGRPGAVHLVLPEDLLSDTVDPQSLSLHVEADCLLAPARPAGASRESLAQLAAHLAGTGRALLVVGGGVNRAGAGATVAALAERLTLPLVASMTGQGAVPDRHPHYLGVIGDNGFHPPAIAALEAADLVVYLGSRLGSVVTMGWQSPTPRPSRKLVQIDIDPAVVGNALPLTLGLAAEVGTLLEQLLQRPWGPPCRERLAWLAELQQQRDAWWRSADATLETLDGEPLRAEAVMQALQSRLDVPTIVVADPGTPTPYLSRYLRLPAPGSHYVIPRAFGGLGYAIPAVLGAWKAAPEARILGLFGDGSLGMSAGELETLARLEVPALLLHFNNGCFGLIKAIQRMHSDNTVKSVDFTPLDAARIARAFGLTAWRASDKGSLEAAMTAAFAHRGPALIDLVVESIAEMAPPLHGWLQRLGADPLHSGPQQRVPVGPAKH